MSVEAMEIDRDPVEEKWKGNSMEQIYRGLDPWFYKNFPEVEHSESHTVLYHLPLQESVKPPKPHRGVHRWDSEHVRLPSSPKNQYPVVKEDGTDDIQNRWELIKEAFSKPILSSRALEKAILSYNTRYSKMWKFKALHKLFEEDWKDGRSEIFFSETLPVIIELALRLPDIVCCAIPLLKQNQTKSVSFTQEQVACLLANAFLCTFPRRNTQKSNSEYRLFPDINFNRLFQSPEPQVVEKIKCICNYFRRLCKKIPTGVITIARRSMSTKDFPNWNECYAEFKHARLHVSSEGTIEDQGAGLLQVDFANKFLGGGVLGRGCVQEEIRFVICPEMFISQLITECLQNNEALFMIGCERYNNYTGYASTFKWDGDYEDYTPLDESRRRVCAIVAIDSLHFQKSIDQFREDRMERELKKAYVGYYHPLKTPAPGIATGNWGCGAFGGDKRLKALLQLIVCCTVYRPLVYYTFGDEELRDDFIEMFNYLVQEGFTIEKLWRYLKEFCKVRLRPDQLYPFIYQFHIDQKTKKLTSQESIRKTSSNSKINLSMAENSMQQTGFTVNSFYGRRSSSEEKLNSDEFSATTVLNLKDTKQLTYTTSVLPSTSSKSSFLDSLDQSYYKRSPNRTTDRQNESTTLLKYLDESYNSPTDGDSIKNLKSSVSVNSDINIDNVHEPMAETIDSLKLNNDISQPEESNSQTHKANVDIEDIDVIPASPNSSQLCAIRKSYQKKLTDFFS